MRTHFSRVSVVATLIGLLYCGIAFGAETLCTYSTYKWNVRERKSVGHIKVVKPYHELTEVEIDRASGCTVCEEDQVELLFDGLRPIKVCKHIAPRVKKIIGELQRQHAPLQDVIAYRVGMTRGEVDNDGNRTGFSNHSFGVALDINTDFNGLYENCITINPSCRLIKGGKWDSAQRYSLTRDSLIVVEFKHNGFLWGGEIAGKQKDFMHFSPTGY